MPVLWSLNSEKRLQNRKYLSLDKKRFSSELTGKDLPAHQMADSLSSKRDRAEELIQSVKIFSSLPNKFLDQLFQIQQSKHPIVFPTMKHDKSHTVGSCIRASMYPALLDISKWRELGWGSQKEYQAWLSTSMLFAFSGTAHYCSAPRVFDYKYPDARDESVFERLAPNEIKTTNILSVAGFEYRGYSGDVAGSYEDVAYYSTHIMSMILRAAEETKTTHIVLIPFGMGVFLPQDESYKSKIKENILEGWIDGLSNYKGPKITIHCCLFPGHFATIQDRVSQNKQIELVNTQGQDAYVLTNRLQDSGHNTFMVNAGDHDWIALLDKEGTPGQCGRNHTLFHSTADEYLSLMTLFSFFSIQNMYKFLVLDTCESVDEAVLSIAKFNPELVFLDIQMPNKNGFQLFKEIHDINFEVIFTTAHSEFAIDAIKCSALDYLLKPINYIDLLETVKKFDSKLHKASQQDKLMLLIENIDTGSSEFKKIAFPTETGFELIKTNAILYC